MRSFVGLCLCFLVFTHLCAEIREVQHPKEVESYLQNANNTDWVMLDVDYTLVEPEHPALQMPYLKKNGLRYHKKKSTLTENQKALLPAIMVSQSPNQLTYAGWPAQIRQLQERGVVVLGFTGIDTSVFPGIGYLPAWRTNELKRLGIAFTYPQKFIEFTDFLPVRGTFPLYQEGILYSNMVSKAPVLRAFLEVVNQRPSKIILVDDMRKNLEGVEAELKKEGIPFLGIHYNLQFNDAEVPVVSEEEWDSLWKKLRTRLSLSGYPEGILPTANFAAIEWAIQNIPADTLVIFDVGNVLLTHKDAVLNNPHRPWVKQWLEREVPHLMGKPWRPYSAVIDREAEMVLVNAAMPWVIDHAKQHSKVIALSKFWCGEDGVFEKNRLRTLRNVGIYLQEPFPEVAGWEDRELKATYAEGLVQTESELKGPVLKAFLNTVRWTPKAIVFVDDRRDQCESIKKAADEMKIPALCIHYTEAVDRAVELNPAVADLQLRTLISEKRWLSDEEAEALLDGECVSPLSMFWRCLFYLTPKCFNAAFAA